MFRFFAVCCKNLSFLCSHIGSKMRDDLLIGTEHSRKINPECFTPIQSNPKRLATALESVTDDEKKDIVLSDPKFGMFSLMKYHFKRGYKNDILKKKNAMYCSHIFSLLAFLPIVITFAQWLFFGVLLANEAQDFDGNICPGEGSILEKLMMLGVSMIYFVKSFFFWDNLTDRTRLNKMQPAIDIWVMLDTFQEFGFGLLVYGANLWVIFVENDIKDMVLNSLAFEFIMNLDNEFEEMYFSYLPETAVDIYDNVFVTYHGNQEKLEKRKKTCGFNCIRCITYVPFKLLTIGLLIFPLFCFFMMFYGPYCK
tara:strand:+ start:3248 stop:4177 length:930 start_codon:yes stop_codon:yes gene_type:complete